TPEFIQWLDSKMAAFDKLVPPATVLDAELDERIEAKVRTAITERCARPALRIRSPPPLQRSRSRTRPSLRKASDASSDKSRTGRGATACSQWRARWHEKANDRPLPPHLAGDKRLPTRQRASVWIFTPRVCALAVG